MIKYGYQWIFPSDGEKVAATYLNINKGEITNNILF